LQQLAAMVAGQTARSQTWSKSTTRPSMLDIQVQPRLSLLGGACLYSHRLHCWTMS
jgi:hypothetical protein